MVLADLRAIARRWPNPDPDADTLLRAAERIGPIAAPRPDRFVELLVNEMRTPENEALLAQLLSDTWPTGITFSSLLRLGGGGPQWEVDRPIVAAVPLGDGRLACVAPAGLTIFGPNGASLAAVTFGAGPVAAAAHDGGVVVGLPSEVVEVDVDTAEVLRRVRVAGPLTALGSVAGRIVAGAGSGVVTVVPRTGPIQTLVGHGAQITAIGQVRGALLVADAGGTVGRWDPVSGALLSAFRHRHAVRHFLGLPSGQVVSADDSGRVCWWTADTGEQERVPRSHDGPVTALVDAGDGRSVISAGRDGRVWGRTVDEDSLIVDVGPAVLLAACPDPETLVTWDESRELTWRDPGGGLRGRIRPRESCPSALALVADTARGLVMIVHTAGVVAYPRPTAFDDPGEHPFLRALAVTVDGEIAVGSPAGVLRIPPGAPASAWGSVAPIGLGYVAGYRDHGLLFAAWAGGSLETLSRGDEPGPVFLDERPARLLATDGSTAAVAFTDDQVDIVMTAPQARTGFAARVEHATALAVVDAETVAVGDSHGSVFVARTGARPLMASAGQLAVTAVVGAGAWIIAGTADGTVLRWRPGEPGMAAIGRHDGPVTALAQLGGRFALSASTDATVRVWDVENGVEWAVLAGPAPFHAVASADGRLPVVARSGVDAVWRLEVEIPDVDEPPPIIGEPSDDPSSGVLVFSGDDLGGRLTLSAVGHCEIRAVALLPGGTGGSKRFELIGVAFDAEGRFREPMTPEGRLAVPRRMRPGGSTAVWVFCRPDGTGDPPPVAPLELGLTIVTPSRRHEITYGVRGTQPVA